MTEQEISQKAFEVYPAPLDNSPFISSGFIDEKRREGYIKALQEIECLPILKGWVARDSDDKLCLFDRKPIKYEPVGLWTNTGECMLLRENVFPELTWEDEAIEVELIIRKL